MAQTDNDYFLPADLRISQIPPVGIPKETIPAFNEVYAGVQQLIQLFIASCGVGFRNPGDWSILAGNSTTLLSGNLRRLYITASEDIANGQLISLFNSGGVLKARKANATDNTKPCDGFCSSEGGILTGAVGEVQLSTGVVTGAFVLGSRYFLDTTSGGFTLVAPVAAGNIEQYVGIAIDATHLYFNIAYWIQH